MEQAGSPIKQSGRRIKWSQAYKTADWQKLDEDIDKVLEAAAKVDVERRLQAM